jgi:hypothetical protein
MNIQNIADIRTDYVDDQNLQHIDCWFTEDDNEQGKTVAVVDLDTKKIIFFDNGYRLNEKVKEAINYVLNMELSKQEIEELKEIHDNIRTVLMNNGADEYGDCIIDEICEVTGILPTSVYYIDGE